MDIQVIYILLLVVVTVVCIGVSAGVKYDKTEMTKSSIGIPGHETQNQDLAILSEIDDLKNKITNLTASYDINIDTISYLATSNVIYTYSDGKLTSSYGTPSIKNLNTLFQYKALYTNYDNTVIVPNISGGVVASFPADVTGDNGNITLNKYNSYTYKISLGITATNTTPYYIFIENNALKLTTDEYRADTFMIFSDGILATTTYEYVEVSKPFVDGGTGITLETNSGIFLRVIYYGDTVQPATGALGIRLMFVSKETPTFSPINSIQYFGLTSANLYPPPVKPNTTFLASSANNKITALTPLPQILYNNTFGDALKLGLFAKCITADPTASDAVVNVATYTGITAADETSTTNYRIHYITTHLITNGTIELPSLWLDHTPALQPKYSIYVILANEDTLNIDNLTIRDVNQSKGTQTVVLLGSPKRRPSVYDFQSLLSRTDGIMSAAELTNYAPGNTFSQFFSPYGDYNLDALIFFKFNSNDIPQSINVNSVTYTNIGWEINDAITPGSGPLTFIPILYSRPNQIYTLQKSDFQNYYLFNNGDYTHRVLELDGTGLINFGIAS